MKLLYCPECGDMFNLAEHTKFCHCETSWGQYVSDNDMIYHGGIPFSIHNLEFALAIWSQDQDGEKKYFSAWIPAKDHENIQEL